MKKMMVLFGLLIFLCSAALSGLAEENRAFENVWSVCSVLGSEQAALLDMDGTLWVWPYDSSEPHALCELPVFTLEKGYYDTTGEALRRLEDAVFKLFEADGALYAINMYAGRIGVVDSEGVHWMTGFDNSGLIAPSGWAYQFDDLTVCDGVLFALVDRDEMGKQILRVHLTSGETTRFDAPDVAGMCLQGDRLLLAYLPMDDDMEVLEGAGLMEMNPQTGETRMLSPRLPEGMGTFWGMSASEEAVYLLASNCFFISRDGEDFLPLQNGPHYAAAMRLLPDGRMAVKNDGIVALPMAESPASKQLIVRGHLSIYNMQETYMAAHPEVLLQVKRDSVTPAEAAERIRGGDTETDVFIVRVDASFGALVDKGYAAPLEDHPVIMASAEKLFPAIHSVLLDGQGRLVAYPEEVTVVGWMAKKELWEKYFGDQPLPSTYRELFEDLQAFLAMENADDDLFFDYYDYEMMVQDVIKAHLVEKGDETRFSDPALQESLLLLAQVQQILRERHMETWFEMDMFYEEVGGLHSIFKNVITYSTNTGLRGSDGRSVDVPLSVSGEPITNDRMYVMIVNPTSTRQELAREFIALAARPDMDASRYAILHTDGQPAKWISLEGEEMWLVTPEGLEAWAQAAQSLRFGERELLLGDRMTKQIESLSERYVAGQLPLDQMLRQLDEVAAMMLDERE